ncbi:WD40 repeat domain-containing protein [Tychonema bourrellyi FEM_GT703]|uniref:WD40 repeat domain-containing protein n=2 Tax=Tychonema bourrellyi TaxID=54313 RepID=A0A2G4EXZ5_9CYAN|nr:WD40 repeat domain-containing protein [Tychonema bourrellyi FEM_GT703]
MPQPNLQRTTLNDQSALATAILLKKPGFLENSGFCKHNFTSGEMIMIWNFAQGIITAVNGILGPQTVMAMTQRQNEIDRIASQIEMQNRSLEFQAAMEGVRQEHSKEMEAYRQYCEDVRLQKRLDSEREQLARRFQHEEKLEQYRRETHLILSRAQLLTALTLADDKEIRETFPLKTPARVILDAYKSYQENMKQIPLLVVISPPALQFEKFPHVAQGFGLVENRLIDEIQEFCKHYSITNQERPVRYQGADWESKYSHGKTGIDTLHHVLKSVPTVVLESKFDGDLLRVYVAGWDMMQEVPHYEKVLTIPWKEVLYPIARKYAEEWREYRMKLLEKGRSLEELKRRGGDNELNLLILEEEEEDRELGRGGQHDYQYNVKEDKYIQELAQFLGICHCILVGLMADRYHFYHGDVRPKLPELLPGLLEKMPSNSLNEMLVGEIVSSYQSLYQSIEGKRPNAIPYLLLDLALSLSGLSDKSWAKKQVEFSIKAWLKLRNGVSEEKLGLLNLENLLEVFKSTLTVADSEYVEKLTGCLAAIGESRYREMIGEDIKAERQRQREEVERKRKLENVSVVHTLTGHSDGVNYVAISPDGQTLVSCGDDDTTIKIWQLSTGRELRTLTGHSDSVGSLAISPDGQTLVSGSDDKTIKIWQLSTGRELRTLTGHSDSVGSLAISPDGQTLVSGSDDKTIKIWQLSTGRELRTLTGHSDEVWFVAISPDGQTLVSGSRDQTIKIWELSTGRELHTLTGDYLWASSLAISPDGQTLVSSGECDTTIKIWQLSTGQLLRTLTGHSDEVNSLAISPDGQTLVSGSDDKTIKIWQLSTGQLLRTLTEHSQRVRSLAISPDGQTLVSASDDDTIKIWRVE